MFIPNKSLLIGCTLLFLHTSTDAQNNEGACNNATYLGKEKVPERLIESITSIAQAYCKHNGQKELTITSGVRTADHQARLMQGCLRKNDCGYYANQQAAREIQDNYNAAPNNQKIAAAAATIKDQINRSEPCYISKHLTAYGLDLERWQNGSSLTCRDDLIGDDLLLSNILQNSEYVSHVIYKEGSVCSHFHVNFVGWDRIPGLKSCSKE